MGLRQLPSLRNGRRTVTTLAASLAMGLALAAPASQEQPGMWMTVGTQRFPVRLEDNPTTRALVELLPLALDMEELNGNEKHARVPRSLPTRSMRPGTIRAGDVLLYGDNTLVVFYEALNSSYSYTRIGHIEGVDGLARALGPGHIRVTLTVR